MIRPKTLDDIAREISSEIKNYFWADKDDNAARRNAMNKIAFLAETAVIEIEEVYFEPSHNNED